LVDYAWSWYSVVIGVQAPHRHVDHDRCLFVCLQLEYTLLQITKPLRLHASGESQNLSEHGLWRSYVLKVHLSNNTAETKTEEQTPLTDLPIQWLEQYRLPHGKAVMMPLFV